jgi:hypothetical protein
MRQTGFASLAKNGLSLGAEFQDIQESGRDSIYNPNMIAE